MIDLQKVKARLNHLNNQWGNKDLASDERRRLVDSTQQFITDTWYQIHKLVADTESQKQQLTSDYLLLMEGGDSQPNLDLIVQINTALNQVGYGGNLKDLLMGMNKIDNEVKTAVVEELDVVVRRLRTAYLIIDGIHQLDQCWRQGIKPHV